MLPDHSSGTLQYAVDNLVVCHAFHWLGVVGLELDMTDLDEHLKQLVLTAQAATDLTERRILLTEIWQTLYTSNRLYRPARDKISGNYQDIYDEALLNLLEYLGRNIHKYDSARSSVIGWVNMLLERRFVRDAIIRWQQEQNQFTHPTLADLDSPDDFDLPAPAPDVSPMQLIQQCFEDDPDDRFKNERMKSCPNISFQTIALRHHCHNESFTEIANTFEVPYTSLVSFYQRRLKTFAPLIRDYVEQHL